MKVHSCSSLFINSLLLLILFVLGGCAPKTTVVLLPESDGKIGHLIVKNDIGSVELNEAQEATVIKGKKAAPTSPKLLSKEEIQTSFSSALAALPEQPVHFILYFLKNSNQLTDTSKKLLEKVLQTIYERQSQEITVFGHTDTVGNQQYNMRLSTERAEATRQLLIDLGINPDYISATSHGENNPLIKTADNTFEQRNRRVEVVIK